MAVWPSGVTNEMEISQALPNEIIVREIQFSGKVPVVFPSISAIIIVLYDAPSGFNDAYNEPQFTEKHGMGKWYINIKDKTAKYGEVDRSRQIVRTIRLNPKQVFMTFC